MVKVGILTFFRPINMGAVLQATATNKIILPQLGCYSELIDYRLKRIETYRSLFCLEGIKQSKGLKNKLKSIITFFLFLPVRIVRNHKFDSFIKKYLNLSIPFYSNDELTKGCQYFDKYIVGSDLVWSPLMAEGINPIYFLSFVGDGKTKISYAPSIGKEYLSESEIELYKKNISQLDYVSTRENCNAIQLSEACARDVKCVLDPTLLTQKKQWDIFYQKPRIIKQKYIFIYNLEQNDLVAKTAGNLSKKYGLRIVSTSRVKGLNHKCYSILNYIGPSEFLNLVSNAEYVITNSFHGCAFAIIFEKELYCIPHTTRGIRMIELLDKLGMEKRIIKSNNALEYNHLDYEIINKKRNELAKDSFDFLKSSLGVNL